MQRLHFFKVLMDPMPATAMQLAHLGPSALRSQNRIPLTSPSSSLLGFSVPGVLAARKLTLEPLSQIKVIFSSDIVNPFSPLFLYDFDFKNGTNQKSIFLFSRKLKRKQKRQRAETEDKMEDGMDSAQDKWSRFDTIQSLEDRIAVLVRVRDYAQVEINQLSVELALKIAGHHKKEQEMARQEVQEIKGPQAKKDAKDETVGSLSSLEKLIIEKSPHWEISRGQFNDKIYYLQMLYRRPDVDSYLNAEILDTFLWKEGELDSMVLEFYQDRYPAKTENETAATRIALLKKILRDSACQECGSFSHHTRKHERIVEEHQHDQNSSNDKYSKTDNKYDSDKYSKNDSKYIISDDGSSKWRINQICARCASRGHSTGHCPRVIL